MAETPKPTSFRPAERSGEASLNPSALIQANTAFVEAFARASENFLRRVSTFNEEMLGFAAERLQKASEAGEALTKAKDLTDAIHVQQDWVKQATQQYAEQVGRVIELTTRSALASFEPLSNLAEHGGDVAQRGIEDAKRAAQQASN